MLKLDILGLPANLDVSEDGRHEKDLLCNISLLPSVMLTFMSRTSIFKTFNFISGVNVWCKHSIFKMAATSKYNICIISLMFRKFQ